MRWYNNSTGKYSEALKKAIRDGKVVDSVSKMDYNAFVYVFDTGDVRWIGGVDEFNFKVAERWLADNNLPFSSHVVGGKRCARTADIR